MKTDRDIHARRQKKTEQHADNARDDTISNEVSSVLLSEDWLGDDELELYDDFNDFGVHRSDDDF